MGKSVDVSALSDNIVWCSSNLNREVVSIERVGLAHSEASFTHLVNEGYMGGAQ